MGLLPTEKSKPKVEPGTLKWLIYGEPKVGKTSLVSGFEDVLFLKKIWSGRNHNFLVKRSIGLRHASSVMLKH